jgi:uncharacterized protein
MQRYKAVVLGGVVLSVWVILGGGISFYIDAIWFDSIGYYAVFRTILLAKFVCWFGAALLSGLVLGANYWLASRRANEHELWLRQEYIILGDDERRSLVFRAVILVVSGLLGFVVQTRWLTLLEFRYQVQATPYDPIFGKSLSFYFFNLPVLSFILTFLLALLVISILLSAVSYLMHGHLGFSRHLQLTYAARLHLAVLVGLAFCLVAARFWLKRYLLLFAQRETGVTFGAGFTDVHAWLPVYWILTGVFLAIAILFFTAPAFGTLRYAVGGLFVGAVLYLGSGIYPTVVQTFVVEPNELQKESTYLAHHIESTLQAYDLKKVEIRDFRMTGRLDRPGLKRHQGTLQNIRLWDWRPLKDAYDQLQSIRPYYSFEDVDVGRYTVDGNYRQIMLSVRELDFGKISPQAQTWINQYFQYTHGYGVCASPVNEVTAEGLPQFIIADIPPKSKVNLEITRPEIYFGEKTHHPVFVKTKMKEFDYPVGDENAFTTYEADRGLRVGSLVRRLMFAWELGNFQILFTQNFTSDSRVLLHRRIQDRVRRIAPFLDYDRDPYVVISDGRLFWIVDAYTTTGRYPYAQPLGRQFNYIRNSVKVVVDAYLGDVRFYVADNHDPLIQTYVRAFPGLFRPLDEMNSGLRAHLRYPEGLFDVQRAMYCTYHMRDPRVFYNKEDVWEVPNEVYGGSEQPMGSYYMIMTLPPESKEEFVLLIPFTPKNKNNMIAWLAARSDGESYGKLVLYQFPKQQLTYGPMQIEARIDQDPAISQLITLWSQKGSRVIRGNLMVIPIENSVLYVEPLYLHADKSEIPELTRVLAVYENRVVVGETLQEALRAAVDGLPRIPPPPELIEPLYSEAGISSEIQALIEEAVKAFDLGEERLKQGDWPGYGEAQKKLRDLLQKLNAEADGQVSEPRPGTN